MIIDCVKAKTAHGVEIILIVFMASYIYNYICIYVYIEREKEGGRQWREIC